MVYFIGWQENHFGQFVFQDWVDYINTNNLPFLFNVPYIETTERKSVIKYNQKSVKIFEGRFFIHTMLLSEL